MSIFKRSNRSNTDHIDRQAAVTILIAANKLTQLTHLELSRCSNLTTLPHEIEQLTKLTVLSLWGCSILTMLPPEIGQLTQLTYLSLPYCSNLTTLPPKIWQMTQLTELGVSYCGLTELPADIGNLSNLKKLYGQQNKLLRLKRGNG